MLTGASVIQTPKRSKVYRYHSLPRSKLFIPGLGLGELYMLNNCYVTML